VHRCVTPFSRWFSTVGSVGPAGEGPDKQEGRGSGVWIRGLGALPGCATPVASRDTDPTRHLRWRACGQSGR
jgi:hypothetical protein